MMGPSPAGPTPLQLWVLVLLTLVWGLNWPIMKLGVSGTVAQPLAYPPLTFRALSMLGGLPVLGTQMPRRSTSPLPLQAIACALWRR